MLDPGSNNFSDEGVNGQFLDWLGRQAPVNPSDINQIEGKYPIKPPFPAFGGNEGAGRVLEVGRDVRSLLHILNILMHAPAWKSMLLPRLPSRCQGAISSSPCVAYLLRSIARRGSA